MSYLSFNQGGVMSNERVKRYRAKQKELGRKKKEFYLTDSEHSELVERLAAIRKGKGE